MDPTHDASDLLPNIKIEPNCSQAYQSQSQSYPSSFPSSFDSGFFSQHDNEENSYGSWEKPGSSSITVNKDYQQEQSQKSTLTTSSGDVSANLGGSMILEKSSYDTQRQHYSPGKSQFVCFHFSWKWSSSQAGRVLVVNLTLSWHIYCYSTTTETVISYFVVLVAGVHLLLFTCLHLPPSFTGRKWASVRVSLLLSKSRLALQSFLTNVLDSYLLAFINGSFPLVSVCDFVPHELISSGVSRFASSYILILEFVTLLLPHSYRFSVSTDR